MDRNFLSILPDDDIMVRIVVAIVDTIHIDVLAKVLKLPDKHKWLFERRIIIGHSYLYDVAPLLEVFNQRWLSTGSHHEQSINLLILIKKILF